MRITPVALMIAALGASGCDRLPNQQARHPERMWSGHLAQLDGAPVNGTGIVLDTYRDPDSADGEFRYELSNGCVGGGRVSQAGSASAHEVLRPCVAEDFPRLRRLIEITGPGLPPTASGQRLTWTDETADLNSSRGRAQFTATR